jgi:hypothetical protein
MCGDTGDFSSRAPSDGRGSVVATVEGLSESGSDADVSDSCQLLMDVEKHGGGRQVVDLVVVGNNVRVESDTIPNFLGKSGKLVEALVNGDSDTWKDPRGIESAKETEGVLENGIIRSTSALHVSYEGVVGPVVGDMADEELGGPVLSGLAQLGEKKCEIDGGPQILRTRNGDFPIVGPLVSSPSYFAVLGENSLEGEEQSTDPIESFEDRVLPGGGVESKSLCSNGTQRVQLRENKKASVRKNLNNLPFSMLRKLPGGLQGARRKKKHKKQGGRIRGNVVMMDRILELMIFKVRMSWLLIPIVRFNWKWSYLLLVKWGVFLWLQKGALLGWNI